MSKFEYDIFSTCGNCKKEKFITEVYIKEDDNFLYYCKDCVKEWIDEVDYEGDNNDQ